MSENEVRVVAGRGIVVRGNDIDTDRIIPARFLRTVTFEGLGPSAFADDRAQLREAGKTHPFDDERFAAARVLVVNKNFGCGSSREHAPQAIMRWGKGIAAVVGESFAEIFYGNCVSLGVPCPTLSADAIERVMQLVEGDPTTELRLDVEQKTLQVGGDRFEVDIQDAPRQQFLEGRWDSTTELLEGKDAVARTAAGIAYFRGYA